MKITVAIPTYKRPGYMRKAVQSVLLQTKLPDEVLVVSRATDDPTNAAIAEICASNKGPVCIRNIQVQEPGFLPPVNKAIDNATGDVLVLLDDDAEAHPNWLALIYGYYADPRVAAVGGRYVNYFDGIKQSYPAARRAAYLSPYGRMVGNLYRDCAFSGPVDADFLIGGNSSFRTPVVRQCKPDARIGRNVAFHWEVDVGQSIKRLGFRIIFDPNIKVDHHSAPREIDGMRTSNYEGSYWSNYNYSLLMKKHLSLLGFVGFLLYTFAVGGGGSPGAAYILYSKLRGRHMAWRDHIAPSLLGRLAGLVA